MSRIGNRVLAIPEGVTLTLGSNNHLVVKGPKGELSNTFRPNITITIADDTVKTTRPDDQKQNKALHGTTNSLINNMIIGVTHGFKKELIITGVGYKANLRGQTLNLALGFSHEINYHAPHGITLNVPKPTVVQITGNDKQMVNETAAQIRAFRKPEPYKGKGIKYRDEIIIRKEGKAAGK